MPRTLPWEAPSSNGKPPDRRTSSNAPKPLVDDNLDPISPIKEKRTVRPSRTPSTSPPPAAPEVAYMHTGYDFDDKWLMVEDEFYATAKLFTQHIHHAEYVRMKRAAAARGNLVFDSIAHPTDGKTVPQAGTKLSMKAQAHAAEQKKNLRMLNENGHLPNDGDDDDDDDDDEYMRDPLLAGLMTGSMVPIQDLVKITSSQPGDDSGGGHRHIFNETQTSTLLTKPAGNAINRHSINADNGSRLAPESETDLSTDSDSDDGLDLPRLKKASTFSSKDLDARPKTSNDRRHPITPPIQGQQSHTSTGSSGSLDRSVQAHRAIDRPTMTSNSGRGRHEAERNAARAEAARLMARRRANAIEGETEQDATSKKADDVPTWLI